MVSGFGGLRRAFAVCAVLVAIGGLVLAASAMPMLADESPASSAVERGFDDDRGDGAGMDSSSPRADDALDGSMGAPGSGAEAGSGSGPGSGLAGPELGGTLLELAGAFASLGGFSGDLSAGSPATGNGDANLEGETLPEDVPSLEDEPLQEPDGTQFDGDADEFDDSMVDDSAADGAGIDGADVDDSELDTDAFDETTVDGDATADVPGASDDSSLSTDSDFGDGPTPDGSAPNANASGEGSGGWFDIPVSFDGLGGALGSLLGGSAGTGAFDAEGGADANAENFGEDGGDSDDPAASETREGADGSTDSTPETGGEGADESDSGTDSSDAESPLEKTAPDDRPLTLALAAVALLALGYVLYRSDDPVGTLLALPSRLLSLAVGAVVACSNAIERAIGALARLQSIAELPGLVASAILGALASVRTRAREVTDSIGVTGRSSESPVESDPTADPSRTARDRIREAFESVVDASALSRYRVRVATPTDVARSATAAGTPREPVETITDAFRDVEYGDRDPASRVDRVTTAREELRAALERSEFDETDEDAAAETGEGGDGNGGDPE